MILPADMPDISQSDLITVADAFSDAGGTRIVRACAEDQTPGHPVVFPSDLLDDFGSLTGDAGARDILKEHRDRVRLVTLPNRNALTDLDTPEAWAEWRSNNPSR